jgi:outer membrane receptor protein involved in Fe transport
MFTLAADYFTRFVQENIPGDGLQDRLGDFVDPSQSFGLGSLPRLKGTANVVWSYRDFELSTTANYISSYRDDVANGFDREIDDWLTFDFQASYKLPWNMKATLGVLNATDAEPPLAQGAFADNYDRDTHDLRGRVLYVSLNKKF